MDDRQRLEAIVSVINKYLPPLGMHIMDAMSEIISLVDPLPPLPVQPADLHNRLADLHFYEEIAEHYAKCAISPEALRDWVAERVNTPPLPVQGPVGEGFFMPDGEFSGSASKRIGRLRPAPEDAAAGCTIRLLYTAPPLPVQPEERNFCPRCGKRTADLTAIHTCTPPQEKNT